MGITLGEIFTPEVLAKMVELTKQTAPATVAHAVPTVVPCNAGRAAPVLRTRPDWEARRRI